MPEFLKRLFRAGEQKASPKFMSLDGLRYTVSKMDSRYARKTKVPYTFVSMTQSSYDSLAAKDSNTVYFIIG